MITGGHVSEGDLPAIFNAAAQGRIMTIDFKAIRDANPLPQVMQSSGVSLRRDGQEFKGLCPFHREKTPSFTVYQAKSGIWKYHCFGCGAHGDTIDFVKDYYGLSGKKEAAERLSGQVICDAVPYTPPPRPPEVSPFIRPPATAPEIVAGTRTPRLWNPKRDRHTTYEPSAVYTYTDKMGGIIGHVLRIEFDGKKITPFIGWTKENGWSHGSMPAPRPLYRLPAVYANPDADILIVEGEKCAEFAARRLKDENFVAVCWLGGTGAVSQTHWKSLQGRRVYIWPDNDVPGRKAAAEISSALEGIASEVIVFDTEGLNRPEGWDVADFGDSSQNKLEEFIRGFRPPTASPAAPAVIEVADNDIIVAAQDEREILATNQQGYVVSGDTGEPTKTSVMNVQLMLQFMPKYAGIFGWDDFSRRVVILRRPPWQSGWKGVREADDDDLVHCRSFLDHERLTIRMNDLAGIVAAISKDHTVNPLKDAIKQLKWDGVPRIDGGMTDEGDSIKPWMTEYLEADDIPVNKMFGRKWLVSAIARVMNPGAKADSLIVLEGAQGVKKSTAIKVLSDGLVPGYFTDEVDKPGTKDAGLQLQGKWHIELGELSAMSRASVEEVKLWVARTVDRFRPPFGRSTVTYPRACIFSATTNPLGDTGYLKDPTGARRFWPVAVRYIDIERLRQDANQIWAEAVHMYKNGVTWWDETPEEKEMASQAQRSRLEHDPYVDAISDVLGVRTRVTMAQIMNGLAIPIERQSNFTSRRITGAMERLGWISTRHGDKIVFDKPGLT